MGIVREKIIMGSIISYKTGIKLLGLVKFLSRYRLLEDTAVKFVQKYIKIISSHIEFLIMVVKQAKSLGTIIEA